MEERTLEVMASDGASTFYHASRNLVMNDNGVQATVERYNKKEVNYFFYPWHRVVSITWGSHMSEKKKEETNEFEKHLLDVHNCDVFHPLGVCPRDSVLRGDSK